MKKIALSLAVIGLTSLFAAPEKGTLTIQENIIETSSQGDSNVRSVEGTVVPPPKRQQINYADAVLLNYVMQRDSVTFSSSASVPTGFVNVLSEEDIASATTEDEKAKLVSVKGYCLVEETINVGLQPMSARLNCNTNIGAITFFGNYVPYNELETLFVTGLHIEKNGRKYKIENAKVLNESRSSYNVATYVNNRKIEQALLTAGSEVATITQNGANDYLDAVIASKTVQEASGGGEVNNTGSGTVVTQPVVTTNTEPPEAADYIAKGLIDGIGATAKALFDVARTNLPYMYQVVGDSRYYIDLYVNPTEMSLDSTIDNNINEANYTTLQKGGTK